MSLFEFNLKPIQDIRPWGDRLHWFGLTDGFYYINVGNEQLFRYSQEILEFWSKEDSEIDYLNEPYMDYNIVRLYEDLLDILPDIMQPVPRLVYNYISTIEKQNEWEQSIEEIDWPENEDPEFDDFYDLYTNSTNWLCDRRLIGLGGNPGIIIWRVVDTIHIRWDNKDVKQDGIQTWASTSGEYTLPIEEFMIEVKSFHDRFMKDMAERVNCIITQKPVPHINIDLKQLSAEQKEREDSLNKALKVRPDVKSWDKVVSCNHQLLKT